MRLVANHCVAGSVLGRVPGLSERGAGAVPALGLRQRRRACATGLGSSGINGSDRLWRFLLTLVLGRFALGTLWTAQIPLAGRDMVTVTRRAAGASDPRGLRAGTVLSSDLAGGITPPGTPKKVITATLKAAAAFPVRGNN